MALCPRAFVFAATNRSAVSQVQEKKAMVTAFPSETEARAPARRADKFYFAAWRWHFYAGIFVIPFLIILAVTGAIMMIYSGVGNELGQAPSVVVTGDPLPVSRQADAALAAVPGGVLDAYVAPEAAYRPSYFTLMQGDAAMAVAVDPFSGQVLAVTDTARTLRGIAETIHGTLLLGTFGDRLLEIAASLGMVLLATGLYLWWPRGRGLGAALLPRLSTRGRTFWKELHASAGIWMSVMLFMFLLTGMSWTGIWGERFAQPWASFPASKWDDVPLSDLTHVELNTGVLHEVPWGLEKTPMPASGSTAGTPGVTGPVALDSVTAWAIAQGFTGQFRVAVPQGATGVYTVSIDARNGDGGSPADDRYVHLDRYTGKVLADVRVADYPLVGQGMAWGVALHKGMAGTWNFVLNLVSLALILLICVSGIVMWWKRRPNGAGRLAAPPMPHDLPFWKGAVLVGLVISFAFPLAGLTLLAVLALDVLVLPRVPAMRRLLS